MSNEREAKLKTLQATIDRMDKTYGKGAIMRLGDKQAIEVDVIPTGSLGLDIALGCNGYPKGRIIEIYGPESSGKTTLALHVLAEEQQKGGVCAFVDAEHALDPIYAEKVGVNVDDLLVSQPDTGEQALEITDMLVRSGAVDAVVVDSVAALTPKAEIEGEMGDSHVGLQARLMSQALRKLAAAINRSRTAVIFINQLREKIGVFFGNPEVTPGGRALKFYSSVRIDLRRAEAIKQSNQIVGSRVRAKVVKNKVAPPFRTAEFDMMFAGGSMGISREGDIIDLGVEKGIISKQGSFFNYGNQRLGQGRENAKEFLRGNPELAEELEAEIRRKAESAVTAVASRPEEPPELA